MRLSENSTEHLRAIICGSPKFQVVVKTEFLYSCAVGEQRVPNMKAVCASEKIFQSSQEGVGV